MGADVMHRGRTDREAGFGMIEVLIAVALYAIALVSLFGLLITSVTAGTIGESSAVAVNLARQRIGGRTRAAGVYQVFIPVLKFAQSTNERLAVQQDVRLAMDRMARDMRESDMSRLQVYPGGTAIGLVTARAGCSGAFMVDAAGGRRAGGGGGHLRRGGPP